LGAIELFVFVQGKENNVSEKPSGLRKPLSSTDKALPKDAKEATDLVQNVTRGEMKTAGYIQSNGSTEKAKLLTGEFPNPQLQESRIIWYKERKSPAKSGGK